MKIEHAKAKIFFFKKVGCFVNVDETYMSEVAHMSQRAGRRKMYPCFSTWNLKNRDVCMFFWTTQYVNIWGFFFFVALF